jgi:hypothetical protein
MREGVRPPGAAAVGVLVGAFTVLAACGGSSKGAQNAAGITQRDTRIVHEDCPIDKGSTEKIDANLDGRPEVSIVSDGGREQCRAVDLNLDGKIDSWIYRDPNGQVRRRENDYDRDGRVDEIAIYRGGLLVEKHESTTLANKIDTWQFYQNGQLARTERDSDGDEVIDQWWEWSKGCPMIHSDVDSDGRPDPGATVDYCKETNYVPPDRQGPRGPSGPSFDKPASLPTELESKEMTTPPGEKPPATPPADQKGKP